MTLVFEIYFGWVFVLMVVMSTCYRLRAFDVCGCGFCLVVDLGFGFWYLGLVSVCLAWGWF